MFKYVDVGDVLQLSLTCADFQDLLTREALWLHFCTRDFSIVTREQARVPCCARSFYRHVLKQFGWSLGYKIMVKGLVGKVVLENGVLMAKPPAVLAQPPWLRVWVEKDQLLMESSCTDNKFHARTVSELQSFLKQNIVVFFFDRYMRVSDTLLHN